MKAIFYLYRTTTKNRMKKALKKPVTYFFLLYIVFIVTVLLGFYGPMVEQWNLASPSGLTTVLTVFGFWTLPANLVSYAKRKGLIFLNSDVHFVFPSPLNPKLILLYAHIKSVLAGLVLSLFAVAAGVLWFHAPLWKMLVYWILGSIADHILEASLMIITYGSERLTKGMLRIIQIFMYGLIGAFLVLGIYQYMNGGMSISSAVAYLHSPYIQMVPIVGWYIGFIHLLFMGATTVNVTVSVLYFLSAAVFLIIAVKMDCQGGYYEDAMKFAEDYTEARQRSKKGEAVVVMGQKKKFGKATVSYKGNYAKAIFYRQLLEYKKNRFFIFGFQTLLCFVIGCALGFLMNQDDTEMNGNIVFIIPGLMAYLVVILSNFKTKWGKEMEMPYTYLIPDSAFHKLWYATLIEHIRAAVEGILLALPAGIVLMRKPELKVSALQIFLCVLIYVCLQACKLYVKVMAETLLGNIVGRMGKQIFVLVLMGIIVGSGVLGAVAGVMFGSVEIGYLLLSGIVALMTAACMTVAAGSFERMETVDG